MMRRIRLRRLPSPERQHNNSSLCVGIFQRNASAHRFHRGSNTTGQSGSGVGLSVVKLLLEAMDGSISVSSEPGMGSCFRIKLRRAT